MVQADALLIPRRILRGRNTGHYSSTGTIAVGRYKYGMRRRKDSQKFVPTMTEINGFLLFINTTRHCGQYIDRYFAKLSLARIRQTPQFLFKFLRINFEKRISYHDLCRNMRTNANNHPANGRTSEETIVAVVQRSFEPRIWYDRSAIEAIIYGEPQLDRHIFYIASRFLSEPIPQIFSNQLMYFTDYCNPSALKPVHCFP